MARGGRNIPSLKDAWALKGDLVVQTYKGQLYVRHWPKPFGKARSQAQKDSQTAFSQIQRAMKFQDPRFWVEAIESTKGTGMYPRDYMMSAMSGNMFLVESMTTGQISAAIDRIAIHARGETSMTLSNIPPGYTGLIITGTARSLKAATTDFLNFILNTDVSAAYSTLRWNQFGATYSINQTAASVGQINGATAPAGFASPFRLEIPLYAGTDFFKNFLSEEAVALANTSGNLAVEHLCGWWQKTDAINRIDFTLPAGFTKGSTITIFGRY